MSKLTMREILEDVASGVGADVYEEYSGRAMYGRKCIGISCERDNYLYVIATVGLRGAKTDSMGRDMIVYWPHLTGDEEIETCDECGRVVE